MLNLGEPLNTTIINDKAKFHQKEMYESSNKNKKKQIVVNYQLTVGLSKLSVTSLDSNWSHQSLTKEEFD